MRGPAADPAHPASTPVPTPPRTLPSRGAHRVRVRYAECDPMGVAHHASYAPWMEEARTEMLRTSGVTYADLEASGVFLVITKLEIAYRRPIRYDDVVELRVEVSPHGRARLRHTYALALIERRGGPPNPADPATPADGVCATAFTELACVGPDGRPKPLPEWLTGAAHAAPGA